ncbi:MAG: hypothetical protein AB7S78_06505 [Candidatus Omnitrophota bacterium]
MKRYNIIFFSLVLMMFMITVVSNVVTDIHRVFGLTEINTRNIHDNGRFRKIQYIKEHPGFNAFILGSSRTNMIDVDMANQRSGQFYYNLAVGSESINGMEKKLRWLIKTQERVNQLIIGLEYDVMFLCEDVPDDSLFAKEHPEVSGSSWIDFYFPYLFKFNLKEWRRTVKKRNEPVYYQADLTTGQWSYPESDRLIEEDPDGYAKTRIVEDLACEPGQGRVKINLERFKRLMALIRENGIPTFIFNSPYHQIIYKTFDQEEYQDWLRQVKLIAGDLWDFSGYNSVTTDNHLYYESSHYRREVGDMILKTIFSDKPVRKDFGKKL